MPDHMNTLHGRLTSSHPHHPDRTPSSLRPPINSSITSTCSISPNRTAHGNSQTCEVVVDGDGAGREHRAALVERGGENTGA